MIYCLGNIMVRVTVSCMVMVRFWVKVTVTINLTLTKKPKTKPPNLLAYWEYLFCGLGYSS